MCECVSMTPGVSTFPRASIAVASAGASTDVPSAAILPSRTSTDPFAIAGPAAVMMVTLRITYGGAGRRT
jgi:hypothetical protein